MEGLYFYKLVSPYQEDITKDCKLTVNEIDSNFLNLKNADISAATYDKEEQLLTLTRNDGSTLTAEIPYTKPSSAITFNVIYDKEKGTITIIHDNEYIIDGLVTEANIHKNTLVSAATDDTIDGDGRVCNPLSLSLAERTGEFKPVDRLIDIANGESLPTSEEVVRGDRFLTHEKTSIYGYLYNYNSVENIASRLENGWRVPTKSDWDGLLNAIEPCDAFKNHDLTEANQTLGKYAGKYLKSDDKWLKYELTAAERNILAGISTVTTDGLTTKTTIEEKFVDPNGTDDYGMDILGSGYYDDGDVHAYFSKRGYYWSSTRCHATDLYVKRFDYDKSGVVQMVESPSSFFSLRLCKDYDGCEYKGYESIDGIFYKTLLLPSETSESGFLIWTAENITSTNGEMEYKVPASEEEDSFREAYFINEWNGERWVRKELSEGESVVVKEDGDDIDTLYRVVDGKLVDIEGDFSSDIESKLEVIRKYIDSLSGSSISAATQIVKLRSDVDDVTKKLEDEITRSIEAESGLSDSINSEEARAKEAEDALTVLLNNEIARASNAESGLSDSIKDETDRAKEAESGLSDSIKAEATRASNAENDLINSLGAEETRAKNAESGLSDSIKAETDRAEAVEDFLQAEIDKIIDEDTHDDKKLSGLTIALDNEIARAKGAESALTDSLKDEIDRAIAREDELSGYTKSESDALRELISQGAIDLEELEKSLKEETDRALSAESLINDSVNAETDRAKTVEQELFEALKSEIERATNKENELSASTKSDIEVLSAAIDSNSVRIDSLEKDLSEETNRALSAESLINDAIDAETDRAKEAESDLTDAINDEAERAKNAESALTDALNAEIARAENAESGLTDSLNAETSRAKEREDELESLIESGSTTTDDIKKELEAEIARAENAESALTDAINSETDRAKEAESGLTDSLNAETSRAKEREDELEGLIKACSASTDDVNEELKEEEARAKEAESALTDAIDAEEARATLKENDLLELINKNEEDSEEKDAKLNEKLADEITRAKDAETILGQKIQDEAIARQTLDTQLANMDSQLSSVDVELRSEISALVTRVDTVSEKVDVEVTKEETRAISAETALDSKINTVNTDLINEVARAENAEAQLKKYILDNKDEFVDSDTIDFVTVENTDTTNTVSANVIVSSNNGNIITAESNGLYARSELTYNEVTNTLQFTNTNGTNTINLVGINFISGADYDAEHEIIRIYYQKPNEEAKDNVLEISVKSLVSWFDAKNGLSGYTTADGASIIGINLDETGSDKLSISDYGLKLSPDLDFSKINGDGEIVIGNVDDDEYDGEIVE